MRTYCKQYKEEDVVCRRRPCFASTGKSQRELELGHENAALRRINEIQKDAFGFL